jgi:hypothetical protein
VSPDPNFAHKNRKESTLLKDNMGTRLRKDSSIPHIHGRGDGNDLNINHTSFQDNRFADEDNEGVLTKIAPRAKRGPSGPMSSHNLNK